MSFPPVRIALFVTAVRAAQAAPCVCCAPASIANAEAVLMPLVLFALTFTGSVWLSDEWKPRKWPFRLTRVPVGEAPGSRGALRRLQVRRSGAATDDFPRGVLSFEPSGRSGSGEIRVRGSDDWRLRVSPEGRVRGTFKEQPVDLCLLTHATQGRDAGLYGYVGGHRLSMPVDNGGSARLDTPLPLVDKLQTWPGLIFSAGMLLALLALLLPALTGTLEMLLTLSMPPYLVLYWMLPPAIVWGCFMFARAFGDRDVNLWWVLIFVLAVPGIACCYAGVLYFDKAEYCGPAVTPDGNATLVGLFCADAERISYGCVSTSAFTGECERPQWYSWCVSTRAPDVDPDVFRDVLPNVLRGVAILTAVALTGLSGVDPRDFHAGRDPPSPWAALRSVNAGVKGRAHREMVAWWGGLGGVSLT